MKFEPGARVVVFSNEATTMSGMGPHRYETPVAVTVLEGWDATDEYGEHYRVCIAGEDDAYVSEGDIVSKALWDHHVPDESVSHDDSPDVVNHPPHYTGHPSGIECIQITEHMSFTLGNAVKYLWRADLKNDAIEDMKKARWYIDREIAKRESEQLQSA